MSETLAIYTFSKLLITVDSQLDWKNEFQKHAKIQIITSDKITSPQVCKIVYCNSSHRDATVHNYID